MARYEKGNWPRMNPITWQKIAGRGALGDTNWGAAGRPLPVLKKELVELKKHIGEEVLLTGGGGPGGNLAILKGASIVKEGFMVGQPALKVRLVVIKGVMAGSTNFDPWIDSWQISVKRGTTNPNKAWHEKRAEQLSGAGDAERMVGARMENNFAIWASNPSPGYWPMDRVMWLADQIILPELMEWQRGTKFSLADVRVIVAKHKEGMANTAVDITIRQALKFLVQSGDIITMSKNDTWAIITKPTGNPFVRPFNKEGIIREIRKAYSDSSAQTSAYNQRWSIPSKWGDRELKFKASAQVPARELYEYVRYIGGYNRFSPTRVSRMLKQIDPEARVLVGREYSVVLYVAPSSHEKLVAIEQAFKGYADEIHKTDLGLRLWWD
jgi:hypothetical protein